MAHNIAASSCHSVALTFKTFTVQCFYQCPMQWFWVWAEVTCSCSLARLQCAASQRTALGRSLLPMMEALPSAAFEALHCIMVTHVCSLQVRMCMHTWRHQ